MAAANLLRWQETQKVSGPAAFWQFVLCEHSLMSSRSSLLAARIFMAYVSMLYSRGRKYQAALVVARRRTRTATKDAIANSIETRNAVQSTAT
jgi:hypothetical protein